MLVVEGRIEVVEIAPDFGVKVVRENVLQMHHNSSNPMKRHFQGNIPSPGKGPKLMLFGRKFHTFQSSYSNTESLLNAKYRYAERVLLFIEYHSKMKKLAQSIQL